MTGRIMDESMGDSLNIAGGRFENNYVSGLGVQWFTNRFRLFDLGYEAGAARRYGEGDSLELWTGLVARFRDLDLSADWRLTPSLVFGLSYVDAAQPGRESRQADKYGGDPSLLFYLSPEIELSRPDRHWGWFWRLHHRSGGGQTLGNMKGATNANVIGLRMRF